MIEAVIVASSDNKNRSGPTASSGCPTPTDHAGDHRLIAPDHAVEIYPQDAIPGRRLHLVNGQARLNRRRADEAVDLAEFALDPAQHIEHRGAIGHVEASRRNSRNAR